MNFDLDSSRKILKIVGIVTIIGAVFTLIGGLLMVVGGGAIGVASPEVQTDTDLQTGVGALIAGGAIVIISGIVSLISGIVSVKASKENRYGKPAWIFAIIGIVLAVINGVSSISSGVTFTGILSVLLNIALNVMIYFAANTIKTAYESGQA